MTTNTTAVVALAALLAAPAARADEVPDALSVEWNGHHPCEKLDEDAYIRVLRCTFKPGDVHVRHSHPASFGCAISGGHGQVVDSKGTREVETKDGQCFTNPPIPWHEFTNTGTTTIQYIIVEKKYLPPPRPAE
jgi:mannose-6-phosphate isomerase-like protein (cupin superfamily)